MSLHKTAVIIGATGLVGNYLLQALINDEQYSLIKVITRRPTNLNSPKIVETITDFKSMDMLKNVISGDVLFCCTGTTIAKAGSKENFRKVDFELPVLTGQIAKQNGIEKMLVVSSIGADAKSSNFYLRTKGEMENALAALNFQSLTFFRPSMLLGPRSESRFGESAGKILMNGLGFLFVGKLKKYKAIHALTVANAMIKVAGSQNAPRVIASDEIAALLK